MATSLAAQLAGIRANNNATILDKSKRKKIHSVSLVYDAKEAATQDFESIYYDCLEAFRELESIDKRFGAFSSSLFSETSIRFDRLGQNNEQAFALNQAIEQFLMLVSGFLQLTPSFRALEWLVRRFQIQIHNAESLLLATLPWHDSEQFVRILEIINPSHFPHLFQFLVTSKQSFQGPSKSALTRVLLKDSQLHEVFNAFSILVITRGYAYDRQLVFWSSFNIYVAIAHKEQGEADQATDKVLPAVSEVITQTRYPTAQIAAYTVLVVLAKQFALSHDVLEAAIETIVQTWSPSSKGQGVLCVSQLSAALNQVVTLDEKSWLALVSTFGSILKLSEALVALSSTHQVNNFAQRVVLSCMKYDPEHLPLVVAVVREIRLSETFVQEILEFIAKNSPFSPKLNNALIEIVELAAPTLSEAQLDQLELSLQSSIRRPSIMAAEENEDAEITAAKPGLEAPSQPESKNSIIEKAGNMTQSTAKSFLEVPLPHSDERAQLWVRASGLDFSIDQLRQLARVSPDAELSFALAIAIGAWPTISRVMALQVAFSSITDGVDYQAMIPIILFLLSDPERRVRQGAASLLEKLNGTKLAKSTPRWGSANGLKWLNKNDLQLIVKRLIDTSPECVMDREYVLTATRQAGKAAWCEFLVSHALTTQLPQVLWVTLRSLANFKGVVKQIAPLMETWNKPNVQEKWQRLASDAKFPSSGLDKVLIKTMRSNDTHGISFLIDVMRHREVNLAEVAGLHIAEIWKEDILRSDNRERLAEAMVEISVDDSVVYDPGDVLNQLQPFSASFFTVLLDRSRTEKPLFNEATVKRRRRRSSSTVQLRGGPEQEIAAAAEVHLRRTTLILELLERAAPELEDTAKLLAILFDILEELMALGQDSRLSVLYTEELLANCMISLVEGLKQRGVKPSDLSTLKVNVAVSCIRTSSSPQVQNRLLLLIAALATLSPDVVLHSVMPIFTFMGANTVRLDNDFSAHVIQQTIEQVIPALVACGDMHEEIEMALMSFVAAFPHIPRHRRNKLFGALIKTLGAEQSLYKLLLLLGQRYAAALSSKKQADAKALVHFTTPFLRSFTVGEQLLAMNGYVKFVASETGENSRFGLLKIREELDNSPRFRNSLFEFLVKTAGESEVIAGTHPLRTQIGKLSESQWELGTSMVDLLLAQSLPAAADLLVKCLELLPIDRFIQVVRPLLSSTSTKVLELVSAKFEYEVAEDPVAVEAAEEVIDMFIELLVAEPTHLVIDALDPIITKFGLKLREAEVKLLEVLVGPSGILNRDAQVLLSTLSCISILSQHLGAAFIGFFPRVFPVLQAQVHEIQAGESSMSTKPSGNVDSDAMSVDGEDEEDESDEDEDEDELDNNDNIQLAVFALYAGFVRLIPAFMSPETPQVLQLLFASRISPDSRARVLEVLEEQLQPRDLLIALSKTWDATLKGGLPSMLLFFTALNSVVERAAKKDVAAESSALTTCLLSCLSARSMSNDQNLINQVEANATESTLAIVLKLNDRVFRPLFVKIMQWGFQGDQTRQIPALKLALRIFGRLKGIVTNYFGYILDDVSRLLQRSETDAMVRKLALQGLTVSFTYDQDDFWQSPTRFDQISGILLAQLSAEPMTHGPLIVKALTALALVSSPQHRKKINDGLAQRITSSSPNSQKIWTVKVLSSLYTKLGEEWVANLPQLVPLIAELLDDEEESVELETRKSLVPVIEDVLGESLDRYLA